jgi:type IX secretion system PorP/SprF family membrane protein
MKYFYCLVLVFPFLSRVNAQTMESVPVQFGQFFNAYSIINPASCGSKSDIEFELGRQGHGGIWKNVSTTYASGSFRIAPSTKKNNFHVIGLTFLGDKEGVYLNRSRIYLNYGWHTHLTKRLSVGAAASMGFFSYLVSGSNANATGGAAAPDGSLGLWLYSQRCYLGVSASQLFNSEVTPLQETTRLPRHYNVTGGYSIRMSQWLAVVPKMVVRYTPDYPLDIDVAVTSVVNNIVSGGINYRYDKGIVYMVGLERLRIKKGNFKVTFSYTMPAGRLLNNIQTYELALNYDYKRSKKAKPK